MTNRRHIQRALRDVLGSLSAAHMVLVLILFVAISWLADGIAMMLDMGLLARGLAPVSSALVMVGFALLTLLGLRLVLGRHLGLELSFRAVRVSGVAKVRTLVLFLSEEQPHQVALRVRLMESAAERGPFVNEATVAPAAGQLHPWQQCLRGLRPHALSLNRVVLVCSPQSHAQVDNFLALGLACLPELRCWHRFEVAVADFHDLETLVQTIEGAVGATANSAESGVTLIDFTSGTKTCSAAAMACAVSGTRMAQYINAQGRPDIYSPSWEPVS